MRASIFGVLSLVLAACGGSTDTVATRYNFAVIAGANQSSVAGEAHLVAPITSQLTRDPQGQFATRVFNFLAPAVAYAQSVGLPGTPVQGAIVCGRVAAFGEPQVVPLCAFTLADGKAANTVQGGTKAGTYNVLFTAQVPSQAPVEDSTTVTVRAGPFASTLFIHGNGFGCWTFFPDFDPRFGGKPFVGDQFNNAIPYRFVTKGPFAHVASDVIGSEGARTFVEDSTTDPATKESQVVTVETATGVIATGTLTAPSAGCVSLDF